jgi:hypothetical protein
VRTRDYDAVQSGRDVGRIFKPRAGWMWTIIGAVVAPHLPSHGFCAGLDEALGEIRRNLARVDDLG